MNEDQERERIEREEAEQGAAILRSFQQRKAAERQQLYAALDAGLAAKTQDAQDEQEDEDDS